MAGRSRDVLFIAHDFPPASGSGANRALAMTRYLPENGWRPMVLTTGQEWMAHADPHLLASVPPKTRVVRTPSFESRPSHRGSGGLLSASAPLGGGEDLKTLPRWRRHIGHARRFPDAHRGWIPFAVAAGLRTVWEYRPRALYSTAGPFSSHVVGLALQRLTHLPWLVELRDGWYRWNRAIFPDYPAWRDWLECRLEGAVVHTAARVVLVTDQMAEAFREQYASLPPQHFTVVHNGFDPAQYARLPAFCPQPGRFEVVHAGSLYYGRSIEAFLEAVGRLAARDAEFRSAFRLTLLGTLDQRAEQEITRQAARWALGEHVRFGGYLEHQDALAAMRQADALLLLTNTTAGAEATVPGKLFEYLGVGRPILAITPPRATGEAIVHETRSGWVAPAHNVDAILEQLTACFAAYRAHVPFKVDDEAIHRYDRRVQAARLAAHLDEIAAAVA